MPLPVILVVEDDRNSLKLLSVRLSGLGCRTVAATTVQEAVDVASAYLPALAFVDFGLNGEPLGGLEVIRALRDDPRVPRFPIFIHSILVSYESEIPTAAGMVEGHLPKPFTRGELAAILETVLGKDARGA